MPGSVFGGLDPASLAELNRLRLTSIYPSGATVFLQKGRSNAIWHVCSGRVKLWRASADGRAIVLGTATHGDVLGMRPLLLGTSHDVTAQAFEETKLCFVPRGDFLAFLARNGSVSRHVTQKLSAELGEAHEQLAGAVVTPVAERLTRLLPYLCQIHGETVPDGVSLAANMSQEGMAELLCVLRRRIASDRAALKKFLARAGARPPSPGLRSHDVELANWRNREGQLASTLQGWSG